MTTVIIKDTGYIKPGEETGTAYSGTDIANAGEEIPLKVSSINYSRGLSFDNNPQPGTYEESRLNFVSVTNAIITIDGLIKDNADVSLSTSVTKEIYGSTPVLKDWEGNTTTKEIDMLYILDKLTTTKGYKELYYKDSTSNNQLLYGLGITDDYNTTYRHLHVRVKSLRIQQDATTGLIRWTLTCEVDKGETA